ncbi:MAG TPA: NAD(P)H-dependent oxidoreductase [Usitatibacter sp.]|nr:NAD(P)H-dependent oxidoreductase [Usitatibacter sp.]
MILVLYAHPYPHYSRACATLLEAIQDLPGLQVRSLYDLYPDFDIDVRAEQDALEAAGLVVWMGPLYWYTVPALLNHWFEKVLVRGFAYGSGTARLAGKDCLWVATAGGDAKAFSAQGRHGHPFDAFVPVIEQTARFCRMEWLPPFTLLGAHEVRETVLREEGVKLRERLEDWIRNRAGAAAALLQSGAQGDA